MADPHADLQLPTDIHALYDELTQAFRDYVSQGEETMAVINSVMDHPIPMDEWLSLIQRRQDENHSHERYQICREKMFGLLRPAHEIK